MLRQPRFQPMISFLLREHSNEIPLAWVNGGPNSKPLTPMLSPSASNLMTALAADVARLENESLLAESGIQSRPSH